ARYARAPDSRRSSSTSRRIRRSATPGRRPPLSSPPVDRDRDGDARDRDPSDRVDMALQMTLHRLAAPDHEAGDQEKARATADEGGNNEQRQEVIERTGRDREDLVGNRREARDEHRDEPPRREELRRRDVLIPITGLP